MSLDDYELIVRTLTPTERFDALMYFVERAINEPKIAREQRERDELSHADAERAASMPQYIDAGLDETHGD